jgi:hypothetical protein
MAEPGPNRSMPTATDKWPPPAHPGREQDRATLNHAQGPGAAPLVPPMSNGSHLCATLVCSCTPRSIASPSICRLNLFPVLLASKRVSRPQSSSQTPDGPSRARSGICWFLVSSTALFLRLVHRHLTGILWLLFLSNLGYSRIEFGVAHDSRNVSRPCFIMNLPIGIASGMVCSPASRKRQRAWPVGQALADKMEAQRYDTPGALRRAELAAFHLCVMSWFSCFAGSHLSREMGIKSQWE